MLSPTLIGDQVVQVGEPREERLLAAMWVMKAFHGEQFPLYSGSQLDVPHSIEFCGNVVSPPQLP
jgi:hypothetical protein